jgi:hypothetical protein
MIVLMIVVLLAAQGGSQIYSRCGTERAQSSVTGNTWMKLFVIDKESSTRVSCVLGRRDKQYIMQSDVCAVTTLSPNMPAQAR